MPTKAQWESYFRRKKVFTEVLKEEKSRLSDGDMKALMDRKHDDRPESLQYTSSHPVIQERITTKMAALNKKGSGPTSVVNAYFTYLWTLQHYVQDFRKQMIKHSEDRFINVVEESKEYSVQAVSNRLAGWWKGGYSHPLTIKQSSKDHCVGFDGDKTFCVSTGFHRMSKKWSEQVIDSVCIVDIRNADKLGTTETAEAMGFVMKAGSGGYRQKYKYEFVKGFVAVDRQWNLYAFSSVSRDRALRTLSSRIIKKIDNRLTGEAK